MEEAWTVCNTRKTGAKQRAWRKCKEEGGGERQRGKARDCLEGFNMRMRRTLFLLLTPLQERDFRVFKVTTS